MLGFGRIKPSDQAKDELRDLAHERFVLQKNMLHDMHRMAYINERESQLKQDFPTIDARTTQPVTEALT